MSPLDDLPDPNAPIAPFPPEAVPEALANVVRDLQAKPGRYRCWGVWWWPLKAMLIRAGMAAQVRGLGSYMDPEAIATLPRDDLSPGRVLAEGLRHYQWAARLGGAAEWADTPDGDRIRIHDPDMET
jgi:hypothetical protein